MTIRRRVEIECCRAGISRAELARRVGKLPQAVNDMLARGDMKASLLKLISEELDVTMECLMTPVGDAEYKVTKRKLMTARSALGKPGITSDFFG